MRFVCNWQCSKEEAIETLLTKRDFIALDIETVDLVNTLPLGIGLAISKDKGYYFFNPRDELLRKALACASKVILHNAPFDIPILKSLGLPVNGYEDSMVLAYSNGIMEISLKDLASSILLKDNPSVKSLWRKGQKSNIGMNHLDLAGICLKHALNTFALFGKLDKVPLYEELDRPYIDCIMEMERWGLYIDQYALTIVEHETMVRVAALEQELYQELGGINLNSNPQVAKALQTRGILGTRKTKAGAESVSDESLAPLNNPTANKILTYRSEMKTISTYVPAFRAADQDGRIHTTFGYAETGRLRSSNPNLQNISNNKLRNCIAAPNGYTFISLDASQLELRVVALLSQDPLLLRALESEDLHMATAVQVFGLTEDKEEMARRRYDAKQLNFAVLYGADAYKVSEMAGCSLQEAETLIAAYFNKYKILAAWIKQKRAEAKKVGYVLNLFGRKRPLPDLTAGSWQQRAKGEREVINTIVQGTAADVIKKMQLYLEIIIRSRAHFVLQVHDELIMEVPNGYLKAVLEDIKELSGAFPNYPVKVSIGQNYGEMEEVKL